MSAEHYRFPFFIIFRPFQGFWDLKYEKMGNVKIAIVIVFLMALTSIIQRQFAGFLVNYNNLRELNSLDELQFVVLPFFLWCVANWSLTTLMDGEGTFKEIVMAAGYALLPMIVINLPLTLFSNVINLEESAFYYFFQSVGFVWFVWLLFVGTMTIHQYTVTKTVVTMLLTLVVMGIIVFLGLLVFSLVQQIVAFVYTVYQELQLRR